MAVAQSATCATRLLLACCGANGEIVRWASVKPLAIYTCKLSEAQAASLREYLAGHDYIFRDVPYASYAAGKAQVQVVMYESGKLVVQGKGTGEFVEFVLEPEVLKEAKLGYEAV